METRVLLFVQEGSAKQKYLDELVKCGVKVFVTSSFSELTDEVCSQTYHGLLLDLPMKLKAIKENKSYVYRLVQKFPVSHLISDEKTGTIRCCHISKNSSSNLRDFISSQCVNAVPQKIREEIRKEVNLHLSLYKHLNGKRPERSITKNISSGGCFIISTHRWKYGNDIWIRFEEMKDSNLIQAQIRTVVKWGEARMIPGIGVEFKDLSRFQTEELARVLE